jgi:hypothetical protein
MRATLRHVMSGRERGARSLAATVAAAAAAVCVPGAAAKDFGPGDLRVCGSDACVPITSRPALRVLSGFYYTGADPVRAARPAMGVPAFELRFRNDYVTGVVGTARLDRFLSFGVNLGRFRRGAWYAVPASAAGELRRLTAGMRPFRVTAATLRRSH